MGCPASTQGLQCKTKVIFSEAQDIGHFCSPIPFPVSSVVREGPDTEDGLGMHGGHVGGGKSFPGVGIHCPGRRDTPGQL